MEVCCPTDSINMFIEVELTIQGNPETFDGIGRLDSTTGDLNRLNLVCGINVDPSAAKQDFRLRWIESKAVIREPFE